MPHPEGLVKCAKNLTGRGIGSRRKFGSFPPTIPLRGSPKLANWDASGCIIVSITRVSSDFKPHGDRPELRWGVVENILHLDAKVGAKGLPLSASQNRAVLSREAASERPIIEESKLFLRIERQLDHALEKLIPGNAAKISQHERLDIEPYEIAQFERLGTRGEHEVTMAVVHDDHVARRIEAE